MLGELVKKSRSHRAFTQKKISEGEVRAWIDNARRCPAAMNLQALKYKIITDADGVAKLLPLTRWAASLGIKLPPEGEEPSAFVVMCHDTSLSPIKPIFMIDVGIAAQTVMLSAAEDGYGGCMLGAFDVESVRECLGLCESLTPVLILGLGEPLDDVRLTEASGGEVRYYRDAENVHYVPKRPLDEIIIK